MLASSTCVRANIILPGWTQHTAMLPTAIVLLYYCTTLPVPVRATYLTLVMDLVPGPPA